MTQRPDLMTISMPKSIRKMLNDLETDEKTSRSKIIHQLIIRQFNLQRNSNVAVWRVVQAFESDMLTLAATRKISNNTYITIYQQHIEKIKELLKKEHPEIQKQAEEYEREWKKRDFEMMKEATRKQDELEKK